MSKVYDSLRAGLTTFFNWLPNLIGAIIILVVGYIIARVVAAVVRRVLTAIGVNKLLERGTVAEYKQRHWPSLNVATLISKIVFWFIFLMAILLGLQALRVEALTQFMTSIIAYLPNVVVAIAIILVAVLIASGVRAFVTRITKGTFFGRALATAAPAIVIAIGVFMALTQLRIATQIVVATYVIVLGTAGLGFALAFGLGGKHSAQRMLDESYDKSRAEAAGEQRAEKPDRP